MATAAAPVEDASFRFQATGRVVAIGDLHGDLDATRRALRLAGAVDDKDNWAGGNLVVVQAGDEVDRGDDDRKIIDWFDDLSEQARKTGGAVHALNGNHEVMNVMGDFRYVTKGGFLSFADVTTDDTSKLTVFPMHVRGRAAAFLPGGVYARKLARRPIAVVVNSTIFVHGGLLPKHVGMGPGRINREVSAWMKGDSPIPKSIASDDSPIWSRDLAKPTMNPDDCSALKSVLDSLRARRMVVGHTPQKEGITEGCDGHIWRVDVGLSAHYGHNPAQVLAIDGEVVTVLRDPNPT